MSILETKQAKKLRRELEDALNGAVGMPEGDVFLELVMCVGEFLSDSTICPHCFVEQVADYMSYKKAEQEKDEIATCKKIVGGPVSTDS